MMTIYDSVSVADGQYYDDDPYRLTATFSEGIDGYETELYSFEKLMK